MSAISVWQHCMPETPFETTSVGQNDENQAEINPSTGFEIIYLTSNSPQKRSYEKEAFEEKTYKNKPSSEKKARVETKDVEVRVAHESSKIINDTAGFKPVKISFEAPPKRTYAQGGTGKVTQLNLTMTCYCRCHKGEEEETRQLVQSVAAMKKLVEEQSLRIESLVAENKSSEELLQSKETRIADLVSLEKSLKKEIESLNNRIEKLSIRQITAANDASEDSIVFARLICHKRKFFTRAELLLAQNIYSASSRCYDYMRDVLQFCLPHTRTLLRPLQCSANSYTVEYLNVGESENEIDLESVG